MRIKDLSIPKTVIKKWQGIVDILAEIVSVPAALIMKIEPPDITVFVSSQSPENPYQKGEKASLNTGLYCETVMSSRECLLVPNALKDDKWKENPDIKLGMISYLGYPIEWPDGDIFGTICVLDIKENSYNELYHKLLRQFRDVVEADLKYIYETVVREEQEKETVEKLDKSHKETLHLLEEAEKSRRALLSILEDEKEVEKALRESEMRFRTIFESSPIGVLLTSPEGNFIHVNNYFQKMVMYNSDELKIHFKDITHPDDVHNSMIVLKKLLNGEIQSAKFEKRYIKKNGEIVYCKLNIAPVKVYGDKIEYFITAVEDITEQKRVSEALKESERKFRSIFESFTDVYYRADKNSKLTIISPSVKSYGYDPEKVIGQSVWNFYYDKADGKVFNDTIKREGSVKDYEIRIRDRHGRMIYTSANVHLLYDKDGNIDGVEGVLRDITARKKAEEELRISQEFTRNLIDSSLDMIIAVDKRRRITEFNKAAETTFGYKREEVLGKHVNLLYANVNQGRRVHRMALETGQHIEEIVNIRKNGETFPALLAASTLLNEKGEIIGVMGVSRDITKQKAAEAALKDSEEQFRSLTNTATDAIVGMDENGKITIWNRAASWMFGYKRKEALGQTLHTLLAPQQYQKLAQDGLEQFFESGKGKLIGKTVEITGLRKNGTEFPIELSISKLKHHDHWHATGIIRDITVRKEVEAALRESEEKFRSVIEQSNDGIYVLQGDRFVFINPRFTELVGYELPEISGPDFNFRELIAPEGLKIIEEREAMRKRGEIPPSRYVFKGIRKDGKIRDFEVSITDIEWEGKGATLGIVQDVTERMEAGRKLEEALEKAKEGEKVKSLFLANMSHEIRTPLNAILGFADLLEQTVGHLVGPEEKSFFESIRRGGNRLMRTIHEILDMSQIGAGTFRAERKEVDLVKLAREITDDFLPRVREEGLNLSFDSTISQGWVKGDDYCISQAINNVLENALKYTEKGGIKVNLSQNDRQLILSVADTGIGISKKYMKEIFTVFSQESTGYTKKFQGVGLGLALAKQYLEMCDATIEVESRKGEGSTFTMIFPLVKKAGLKKGEIPVKKKVKAPAVEVKKPLVLLVEDDENSQRLVTFFLKKQYDTTIAVSVKDAKQVLNSEPVALILLDLSLIGEEDGLDLARYLRKTKKWKDIPIIATTAHAFEIDRENCLKAGCNDYLAKPISQKDLLDKIKQWL